MRRGTARGARMTATELRYEELVEIGSGTFGTVYAAARGGQRYALKHYTYSAAPIHTTTIREIKALRALKHPNIVAIEEVVVQRGTLWVVFPLAETDLGHLLNGRPLTPPDQRRVLAGILQGTAHIHSHGFLHRDLKTANVLIDWQGHRGPGAPFSVTICDLGMARPMARDMTPGVVTLWYRAPELLLGSTRYGPSVDIWSIGCILYEIATGTPLFREDSEVVMLERIARVCGSITPQSMPLVSTYPLFSRLVLPEAPRIVGTLPGLASSTQHLLASMLVLDPERRISIADALTHQFFSED